MPSANTLRLNPSKLLLSKWTAVAPRNKEKHFLVRKLIAPEVPDAKVEVVELEAVRTGRSFILPWMELNDASQWLRGWQ
jgi:tryptophan-rich hypothetical protein